MSAQLGEARVKTEAAETTSPASSSPLVEAGKLIERVEELTKAVAKRAYDLFEERGRVIGNELEDWFRAECALLRKVSVTMKESEDQIVVQAEVPGLGANELKINVEPTKLMIEGGSELATEEETGSRPERVVLNERRASRFYRLLELPAEVDPAGVNAILKDGVLEIRLPKVPVREAVGVEVKTV